MRTTKKGSWNQREDELLLQWIDKYGPKKWTECSKKIKGRCGKQCRERWINILNPNLRKSDWCTEEQEQIFYLLQEHQTSWTKIARQMP